MPPLNIFLLVAGLIVAAVAFAWFMRKPQNRKPLPDDEGFENNRDTPLRR